MPSKKSTTKKASRKGAKLTRFHGAPRAQARGAKLTRVHGGERGIMHVYGGDEFPLPPPTHGNGHRKQPRYINPETREEREKRLAARKALTLRAFEMAYENNHRRKAS